MDVSSIKVLWRNHKVEEATWEMEEDIKSKYPFLFFASRICAEGMWSSSYFYFQTLLKERFIALYLCFLT